MIFPKIVLSHEMRKKHKGLQLKTITDREQIDKCIAERNLHHLNQAEGSVFTIEPLKSLIGEDGFTSFANEILKVTVDIFQLNLSPTIKTYLQQLKFNKEIISNVTDTIIPLKSFKEGYKKWMESTTISLSGRYLGHHHALIEK